MYKLTRVPGYNNAKVEGKETKHGTVRDNERGWRRTKAMDGVETGVHCEKEAEREGRWSDGKRGSNKVIKAVLTELNI